MSSILLLFKTKNKFKMYKIVDKYNTLCKTPSDINEHLPTLEKYASIFETGVRGVISSWFSI